MRTITKQSIYSGGSFLFRVDSETPLQTPENSSLHCWLWKSIVCVIVISYVPLRRRRTNQKKYQKNIEYLSRWGAW